MKKVILFDLDGTLLPMDQEVFTKAYFSRLAKFLMPFGYDPKKVVEDVWAGTKAMVTNDGSKTNEEVFWDVFSTLYEKDVTCFSGFVFIYNFGTCKGWRC